jgi:hypothetical protein
VTDQLTFAALPWAVEPARPRVVPGMLHRTVTLIGDVVGAVGLALCLPLAILAIGAPIVLCVKLLLWLVGMWQ